MDKVSIRDANDPMPYDEEHVYGGVEHHTLILNGTCSVALLGCLSMETSSLQARCISSLTIALIQVQCLNDSCLFLCVCGELLYVNV